jgi:hypothetical protein
MIKIASITSAIDREIIESDCGGRYGYIGFIVWIDHGCGAGGLSVMSGIGGAV